MVRRLVVRSHPIFSPQVGLSQDGSSHVALGQLIAEIFTEDGLLEEDGGSGAGPVNVT